MTILAFMQNMWVRNPERVKKAIQEDGEAFRLKFIEYALFAGCKSGRVLRATLGQELCDQIIWEETTREIADKPTTIFPADLVHMEEAVRFHKPDVIVTFGLIAWEAVQALRGKSNCLESVSVIRCMHPAARHPDIIASLTQSRRMIEDLTHGPARS